VGKPDPRLLQDTIRQLQHDIDILKQQVVFTVYRIVIFTRFLFCGIFLFLLFSSDNFGMFTTFVLWQF